MVALGDFGNGVLVPTLARALLKLILLFVSAHASNPRRAGRDPWQN